jgi:ELWxxDGT repeat protein
MKTKITPRHPNILRKLTSTPAQMLRWFLLLFIMFIGTCTYAQFGLVKDINLDETDPFHNEYSELTNINGTLYFIVEGKHLWKTDGTPEGTVPVKSFSGLTGLTPFLGGVYFTAKGSAATGWELWKSDGTEAGTVMIKDIFTGASDGLPQQLTPVNGSLFFIATSAASGREIWKSDGTAAGTQLVKDIKPGAGSSGPAALTGVNGKLFFSATSSTLGNELWVSDGTATGTTMVRDIYAGSNSSFPKHLTSFNGMLLFQATEGVTGRELWKSDGTASGTVLLMDIRAGATGSYPFKFTPVNSIVFFEAHDGIHGKELWKTDGTAAGTVLVKDISPGPSAHSGFAFDHIANLTNINGVLFFVAYHNNNHDVWRSDGTAAGTFPLTTGSSIEFSFIDPMIAEYNGQAYFLTQYQWQEAQLWKSDGTPGGTAPVKTDFSYFNYGAGTLLEASADAVFAVGGATSDEGPGPIRGFKMYVVDSAATGVTQISDIVAPTKSSDPFALTNVNGTIYFGATDSGTADQEDRAEADLWRSDGTEAGTVKVKDFTSLQALTAVDESLFFVGYNGDEYDVWTSDGTETGTHVVKDIDTEEGTFPDNLTNLDGTLFFSITETATGRELWKSDGTAAGTVLVKDINPAGSSNPTNLTDFNGVLYFSTNDNGSGGLWKSDGTFSGTVQVKEVIIGGESLTPAGNTLFFTAADADGFQLWKSDGTAAGTSKVKNIADNVGETAVTELRALDTLLFFTAIQSANRGLWKSDGTAAGTTLLKDFYPGNETIQILAPLGGEMLMLVAPDVSSTSVALWKSDGTIAGTVKVTDIAVSNFTGAEYAVLDSVLYITLTNTLAIWRTDGTACGTYALEHAQQLSVARSLEVSNGALFFSGTERFPGIKGTVGMELFRYTPEEALPCAAFAGRMDVQEPETESSVMISSYPNPFRSAFLLTVAGEENGVYQVQVITVNGVSVEPVRELKFNTDYTLGSQWGSGIYIMKAVVDGKLVTRKLVKTK